MKSHRLKWNSFSSSRVWYLVYVCRPRFLSKNVILTETIISFINKNTLESGILCLLASHAFSLKDNQSTNIRMVKNLTSRVKEGFKNSPTEEKTAPLRLRQSQLIDLLYPPPSYSNHSLSFSDTFCPHSYHPPRPQQTHHLRTHRTGCASRGRGGLVQGHPADHRGAPGLAETVDRCKNLFLRVFLWKF